MGAGPDAPAASRAGFVLVSVLWALVLIAALSALFVSVLGMQLRSNAAIVRSAAAQSMADGAIRVIAYRLAFAPPAAADTPPIPVNGTWFGCAMFDGTGARISVQDQDALIDLNAAPLPLLSTLLVATLDRAEARSAMQTIEAFRAAATEKLVADPEGAAARSLKIGEEGIFAAPDELLSMIGVTGERAASLILLLTIYSQSDGLDPTNAPAALITALGGRPNDAAGSLPPEVVRSSRARFFAITADVGTPRLGRSSRRAIVEVLSEPDRPFAVWEWGTADSARVPAVPASGQSCDGAVAREAG